MRIGNNIRLFAAQVIVPPGFTVVKIEQKTKSEQVILLDKSEYTVFTPNFEGKIDVHCFNC
jgi:hypothetical protein